MVDDDLSSSVISRQFILFLLSVRKDSTTLLCCNDRFGFRSRASSKQSICLCPSSKRRTPNQTTLIAMLHNSARKGQRSVLLIPQWIIKCAVEDTTTGLRACSSLNKRSYCFDRRDPVIGFAHFISICFSGVGGRYPDPNW